MKALTTLILCLLLGGLAPAQFVIDEIDGMSPGQHMASAAADLNNDGLEDLIYTQPGGRGTNVCIRLSSFR